MGLAQQAGETRARLARHAGLLAGYAAGSGWRDRNGCVGSAWPRILDASRQSSGEGELYVAARRKEHLERAPFGYFARERRLLA